MNSVHLTNLFFSLSTFFTILIAGLFPFKKKHHDHGHDVAIGETLATGIFLGAALLHMLPESNLLFKSSNITFPMAYMITGFIFLFFLWFEHLGKELYQHKKNHPTFALVAWLMLSIHSLVSGTALGLSNDVGTRIMLFIAIITHKWAESFSIALQLKKSTLKIRNSFILFLMFACMTPLGIWIGAIFEQDMTTHSLVDPVLMAISAGTFLYLGTLHGLERCVLVERCCNLRDFSFVIIGFIIMATVAIWL